jgi:lipocalin
VPQKQHSHMARALVFTLALMVSAALAIDTVPELDLNAYLGRWYQGA